MGPAGGSGGGGGGGPVVVDGVTITGTGVEGDPLVAEAGTGTVVADGETITGDGSVGDPLVARARFRRSTYGDAAVVYYLRAGGDDANDGLAATAGGPGVGPFATFARLLEAMAGADVNRSIVGDVTGMTITGPDILNLGGDMLGGMMSGFDLNAAVPPAFTAKRHRQLRAELGLVQGLTVTGQAVDADSGHLILTVSDTLVPGAHIGQIAMTETLAEWGSIRDNTANTVLVDVVSNGFTLPVSIYEGGATIRFGNAADDFEQATYLLALCDWTLHGIKFESNGGNAKAAALIVVPVAAVDLLFCSFAGLALTAGPGNITMDSCHVHAKTFAHDGARLTAFNTSFRDVGFQCHGSSDSGINELIGISVDDCTAFGGGNVESRYSYFLSNFVVAGSSEAGLAAVHGISRAEHGRVEDCVGSAIYVAPNTTMYVTDVHGQGTTGRYGIEATHHSDVVATGSTVTGALGDVLCGTKVRTYAQLPVRDDSVYTSVRATGAGEASTIVVDGVTITGTGVEGDPLAAPGAGDALVLVADTLNVVEDTPTVFDLFANDLPVGEWEVHAFRVPSPTAGEPPTEYFPSATAVAITGYGSIVINVDGTGTYTPSSNVHGAVPTLLVIGRGPLGALRYSTFAITVTAVNDPPVARDISGVSIHDPIEETLTTVTLDFGAAVSDPDGDVVELTLINATPIVYDTPIDLDGGTITINEATLLGVVTPDALRTLPILFTYTVTDGVLTAAGDVQVIIAEVENLPMVSPVAPNNPSNDFDVARLGFANAFMQEYGPLWPYVGPPDVGGNLTLVTMPPYSSGQGAFNLAQQEPWLYNRVRGAYLLWQITNDPSYRDIGIEWAELYFAGMGSGGSWNVGTVNPQDAKYKYPESADFYREMTADRDANAGSTVYYGSAHSLYVAMQTAFAPVYDAGSDELWTERNCAYAIRAHMREFYRTGGDPDVLAEAAVYVQMILDMSAVSGAPLHGHNKHEGSAITTPITSAWMGGILVEDMLQYYRHTRDAAVLQWIYDYGVFVVDEGLYIADHTEEPEFAGLEGLRLPAYLFGVGLQFPEGTAADMRHARDVGEMLNKAVWAGTELALDTTALETARDELWAAALVDDAYWTRLTALYIWKRVNPPRSWMWQWGHLYALIYDTGASPPIAPVALTEGTIAGSTQQGQTLTFTPGTERGTPAPTVTWVWQLLGVDIGGTANDLTFATVDVGATSVHVTITNEAGTVEYDTNVITVVPAGAPEITVQPTAQSGLVGAQLVFTCSFTGIPDPTAVVQLDTGGGFVTTATGTLQHTTNLGVVTATWTTDALVLGDDGTQVRFRVNNGVGGDVDSNAVALSVVSQQAAAATSGSAAFIRVTETAGAPGFLNFTWCGWLYIDTTANNASLMEVEGVASRRAIIQIRNGVAEPTIGDSNTGSGTGWATPPATDTWLWVTFRGPAAHPGVFTATYRAQGSGTTYTMTRANGIEDSVTPLSFLIGGGDAPGCNVRAQHWRVYNERFTDQQCIDEMLNYDPTLGVSGNPPVFFIVASDGGGGALALTDASGNAATITNTGGTYTADGPLTGSI